MRQRQYILTRQDVHALTLRHLHRHLGVRDFSPRCSAAMLLAALVAAAAGLTSLVAVARRLLGLPSGETLRKALLANLPGRAELERRLNRALAAALPRGLTRRPQPLAIDLTLRPYHGQPLYDPDEIYRSQAKSGTSHFHAYATAYVVRHGRRSTVALTAVRRGEAMDEVVRRLLRLAARAGVRPRYLLLDRGFYSVAVIRYLQAARRPFVMPLPLRGRKADHPDGPSGSRVFASTRRSGWAEYTLTSGPRTATVRVAVQCRNLAVRRGRRGRQRLVYAFWGLTPPSVEWVRQTYRTRFGIETSYRQMNQAKVHTCTRNPDVRLLFVGVALLLRNLWVWLHHQVLATPRRGGRLLRLERLRFKLLLGWLAAVVESDYAGHDQTPAERPIPTTVTA
jgi:putative transposase